MLLICRGYQKSVKVKLLAKTFEYVYIYVYIISRQKHIENMYIV